MDSTQLLSLRLIRMTRSLGVNSFVVVWVNMKVVLFDLDHTLMHSPPGANARSSRVMFKECFGIDTTEDAVEKVGMTEWGLIEKVLSEKAMVSVEQEDGRMKIQDRVYQVWANALEEECKGKVATLLDGMWELVNELANIKDVQLGILSGNSYWRSEVKLRSVGMDEYFRERTGKLVGAFGNEARTRKGLVAFAKDRLIFLDDKLMIIDDSLIGAQMCKEEGVRSVLVATGSASREELAEYSPFVFDDLGDERWREVVGLVEGM